MLWAECLKQLAPQFPGVEFHCVGHGEYQEPFGLLAKHFKNVKTYLQPHDKVKELYERSHLSVVPSLYSEGTSLSAIEAMCGGCAVIASNVGGLGNLIIPDANGYLIEPTVDNFTRVVTHCLKSPEETQAQGMRAREIAKHGLSLECWEKRIIRQFYWKQWNNATAGLKDVFYRTFICKLKICALICIVRGTIYDAF